MALVDDENIIVGVCGLQMDGLRPGGMTENEDDMILSHATMDKSSNVEYGDAALARNTKSPDRCSSFVPSIVGEALATTGTNSTYKCPPNADSAHPPPAKWLCAGVTRLVAPVLAFGVVLSSASKGPYQYQYQY